MELRNPSHVALRALADEIARAGVTDACVSPGSRSGPLALALAARLRCHPHLDERSAGFFALGLARSSRRPVALACTSGSAVAHLLPAVIEAQCSGVPLLVLSADRPPELRGRRAPQTIDQLGILGSHARSFVELGLPEAGERSLRLLRSAACRAVAEAWGPPGGVVHLNVPLREPLEPWAGGPLPEASDEAREGRAAARPYTRAQTAELAAGGPALEAAADALARSRRPLVVCGPLDEPRDPLLARVSALARRLGAPVLAEPTSNLRCRGVGPAVVGCYDRLLRDPAFARAHRPDAVLRLGAPPTSRVLREWLAQDARAPFVVIDPGPGWSDPDAAATELLRARPAAAIAALLERLGPGTAPEPAWAASWREAGVGAEGDLARRLADLPLFEAHAVTALAEALGRNALGDETLLYVGNSLAVRALDLAWPAAGPAVRVLSNRGANGIDGFVSSALGAAAGHAGPVAALCGDLSFLHDAGGLVAARRVRQPLCLIVLDNQGGGIFDHLPISRLGECERGTARQGRDRRRGRAAAGQDDSPPRAEAGPAGEGASLYEALFAMPPGVDPGAVAEAYGVHCERVSVRGELSGAIARALGRSGATVVRVRINRRASREAHLALWRRPAGARAGEPSLRVAPGAPS